MLKALARLLVSRSVAFDVRIADHEQPPAVGQEALDNLDFFFAVEEVRADDHQSAGVGQNFLQRFGLIGKFDERAHALERDGGQPEAQIDAALRQGAGQRLEAIAADGGVVRQVDHDRPAFDRRFRKLSGDRCRRRSWRRNGRRSDGGGGDLRRRIVAGRRSTLQVAPGGGADQQQQANEEGQQPERASSHGATPPVQLMACLTLAPLRLGAACADAPDRPQARALGRGCENPASELRREALPPATIALR